MRCTHWNLGTHGSFRLPIEGFGKEFCEISGGGGSGAGWRGSGELQVAGGSWQVAERRICVLTLAAGNDDLARTNLVGRCLEPGLQNKNMNEVSPQGVSDLYTRITQELNKVIVGQEEIVRLLLASLFARGHCLLVGVPGLAKTLIVRTLADILHLSFKRIQFTPDLMPSDIIGSEVLQEHERRLNYEFKAGPVFANLILADEINRTPPKTQAALLEAMQERKVTVGGQSRLLPDPFLVVATQNPIEQEGTYPLPEAQLDRFMFSLYLDYPSKAEEKEIVKRTTLRDLPTLTQSVSAEELLEVQRLVLAAPVSDHVIDYAVSLAAATRPGSPDALKEARDYVEWGAGPRASQYLIMGAKALALLRGRISPETGDVREVALPVLQHRVITNYRATGAGKKSRNIVKTILAEVREETYQ
jgi:MoxR-like ATPase